MQQTLRIRIRLDKLRENMSREEQRPLSEADILQWLKDAGFTPEPAGTWLVLERDLGQLDPSEVESVEDA